MAHIPDGVLDAPMLIGGAALAAGGVALGLRRLDEAAIPRAALLAAGFFLCSLVAIPVGPSSVHLLLTGLMGVMLGAGAFPAVLVALLLQAMMFGFGGLTTLGVNTFNIALPGVLIGGALAPMIRSARSPAMRAALAAVVGAGSVLAVGGLIAVELAFTSAEYAPAAQVLLVTFLPLAIGEALVTAAAISFLHRVRPDALAPSPS